MNKKKLIIIVSIIIGALVIVSLYGTFASNTTVDGGDNTYAITLTGSSSEIVVPAGKSKIVIYQITNTNKGKVQYGVVYSGNDITVKYYADSQDAHTGTIDYGENKFIKLNVQNSGTSDSTLTIKTIIGYEKGGSLDSLIPSGYTMVSEKYYPPGNLIGHIISLYKSGTPELKTQETSGDSYYYSYQDAEETWGLMNDGLKIDNTLDAKTTGLATTVTDTTKLTNGTEGNIRYFGPSESVKNYIYFNCNDYSNQSLKDADGKKNCELWRIIGIVDGKVKIIKEESIGNLAWDQDKNQNSSLTTFDNNWKTSSLQEFLNGLYYNRGAKDDHTYLSDSDGSATTTLNLKTIGITEATRNNNLISESTWYLGGYSSSGLYPDDIYNYERTNKVGTTIYSTNDFTINKNIGLMYPSDYGYGTDLTKCSIDIYNYDTVSACKTSNWLFTSQLSQWLITSHSSVSFRAWFVSSAGFVSHLGYVYNANYGVRPVLYLNSELVIESGHEGTSTDPYRIDIDSNVDDDIDINVDNIAPTCTLSVNGDNTVSFVTKSDDVGVEAYGLSNSSTATYSGNNSMDIETGTIYGYVKDAAGNSGSCSVIIKNSNIVTNNITTNCSFDYDGWEEQACQDMGYNYVGNTCQVKDTLWFVEGFQCELEYYEVSCSLYGDMYTFQTTNDMGGATGYFDSFCRDELGENDAVFEGYTEHGAWQSMGGYTDASESECDEYYEYYDGSCSDLAEVKSVCQWETDHTYNGEITCSTDTYSCDTGYTQLNDSYCYKHN